MDVRVVSTWPRGGTQGGELTREGELRGACEGEPARTARAQGCSACAGSAGALLAGAVQMRGTSSLTRRREGGRGAKRESSHLAALSRSHGHNPGVSPSCSTPDELQTRLSIAARSSCPRRPRPGPNARLVPCQVSTTWPERSGDASQPSRPATHLSALREDPSLTRSIIARPSPQQRGNDHRAMTLKHRCLEWVCCETHLSSRTVDLNLDENEAELTA